MVMNRAEVTRAQKCCMACGGTSVMRLLSRAVLLDPPVLLLPVGDLELYQTLGYETPGAPLKPLQDILALPCTATPALLLGVLSSLQRLEGDLLSTEAVAVPVEGADVGIGAIRNMSPDEAFITSPDADSDTICHCFIVKMLTNRSPKVMWAPASSKQEKLAKTAFGDLRSKNRKNNK
ncbi:unnamed protein product [Chrysoparadoxa australica]